MALTRHPSQQISMQQQLQVLLGMPSKEEQTDKSAYRQTEGYKASCAGLNKNTISVAMLTCSIPYISSRGLAVHGSQ